MLLNTKHKCVVLPWAPEEHNSDHGIYFYVSLAAVSVGKTGHIRHSGKAFDLCGRTCEFPNAVEKWMHNCRDHT